MADLVYGSVCSGIESATVAWHGLGLRPAWVSEIAPFPSAVLAARWPSVPNRGDFTRIAHEAPPETVDLLVGGTPCQSFSVAGERAGLDDPRGHLAVEFLLLARRLRARWLVWENVPGVLSVDDGDAFASFLSLAVDVGYGVYWRVLDAQWFGVPQRRRRVFVVGYLGDWRPSCAVLLERPSMRGNPATSGGAWPHVAGGVEGSADAVGDVAATLTGRANQTRVEHTFPLGTLRACAGKSTSSVGPLVAVTPIRDAQRSRVREQNGMGIGRPGAPMFTATTRGDHAIAFHATQDPIGGLRSPCLGAEPGSVGVLSFDEQQITHPENRARVHPGDPSPTLSRQPCIDVAPETLRPRRLTPREWERLQGFPDDYTLIDGASDLQRYEALGNAMAVPVMRWIGRRIVAVEAIRCASQARRAVR